MKVKINGGRFAIMPAFSFCAVLLVHGLACGFASVSRLTGPSVIGGQKITKAGSEIIVASDSDLPPENRTS